MSIVIHAFCGLVLALGCSKGHPDPYREVTSAEIVAVEEPMATVTTPPGDAEFELAPDDQPSKTLLSDEPTTDVADHFPDCLRGLDGRRIRVRGFMYPSFKETGLSSFVLVRDIECTFGPRPKIHHMAEVAMQEGVATDYIHGRPFHVVGTSRIRPKADGDELWQLFQIEDAIIIG